MPHYKLIYFDIRGLAEPIRLTFAQAGVDFEDERLKHDDWPKHKETMPFGQLPVLEVDGKRLTQSMSILRYIGRKYGVEADDEWDRAVGDELATSWLDMFSRSASAWAEQDKELRKQKFNQVIEEFVKPRLRIINDRLSHSTHGFIAGSKVTWADFAMYNTMNMLQDFLKMNFDEFPHVQKFVHTVEHLPKVKEWKAKHPTAQFSVFPSPFD